MSILGFPLFDILDQNKKFGQEKNLLKCLLVMSSSRSDYVTQFVFSLSIPLFLLWSSKSKLLCFNACSVSQVSPQCFVLPVFYQWFTSFSLEFHQCFTSVSPVFHKCYNSVSKSVKILFKSVSKLLFAWKSSGYASIRRACFVPIKLKDNKHNTVVWGSVHMNFVLNELLEVTDM